jgi:glyoxylase-like metal-dependent hydrolase (beta-lactamase superfamily II)
VAVTTIGDAELHVVEEQQVSGPLEESFVGITPSILAAHRDWLVPRFLDADGLRVSSLHSYVLRTESLTMVIDTCCGNDKQRSWLAFADRLSTPYLERLHAAGLAPEDVDVVVCTHLHVDHVGWNTRLVDGRWVPTFPNARYVVARREWEHWRASEPGSPSAEVVADSVVPIVESGQAMFVEPDHVIDPQIRLRPLPGHTPGHVGVELRSGGARAVFSGDLFHHAVQIAEPQIALRGRVGQEWDRDVSIAMRRQLLTAIADTGTRMFPAHFPNPWGFEIRAVGDSWRPIAP